MGEEALLHAPLSYHDVYLYPEDASLVLGAHWWNDQVCAVVCTYHNFGTSTISDEETSANMQSHYWPFPHRSCR